MPRPFNEHILWKGKIQESNYPAPLRKPPMDLPIVNHIVGGTIYDPNIYRNINKSYAAYSAEYWKGVLERRAEYRKINAVPLNNYIVKY
jgi:hypothetical protein|uniref:Uncharacterized protein n=1 Tax=viral metagenome TaxID=1070528 RepID=A0A6C0K775_9ZZZZ